MARSIPAVGQAELESGLVDVWCITLDLASEQVNKLLACLSTQEHEHSKQISGKLHRNRYIAAHVMMRHTLAAYLGLEPADIQIECGSKGKPFLSGDSAHAGLHFNLSHSDNMALLAISQAPVGIDIERVRKDRNLEKVAKRFFSPAEQSALQQLAEKDKLRALFACWTRKEAYIKATGTGLTIPLKSFSVTFAPSQEPFIQTNESNRQPDYILKHLEPAPGFIGALAVKSSNCRLQCWRSTAPLPVA